MMRNLPEDQQVYVVEVLKQIAAAGSDPFVVPETHRVAVLEGLAQAQRGEFVSEDEMSAIWEKCGLRDSCDAVVPANAGTHTPRPIG